MTTPEDADALPPEAVARAIAHMNDDHAEDSLLIVRELAEPSATAARMTGIDGHGGTWVATVAGEERVVRIAWPARVADRTGIRDAVVALHRQARVGYGAGAAGPNDAA